MSATIEFICYPDDPQIEIQLEPECFVFVASPGNALRFVAVEAEADFRWAVRIDPEGNGLQLFPEGGGSHHIQVNDKDGLVEDLCK